VTQAELERAICKRTGLPDSVVALVLTTLKDLISESLERQQDVVFRGLFRISSRVREINSFQTAVGSNEPKRATAYKLVLGIHPVPAFRKELNKWTSTLSSSMTNM
jgi:nucleoid DNA-binding protein